MKLSIKFTSLKMFWFNCASVPFVINIQYRTYRGGPITGRTKPGWHTETYRSIVRTSSIITPIPETKMRKNCNTGQTLDRFVCYLCMHFPKIILNELRKKLVRNVSICQNLYALSFQLQMVMRKQWLKERLLNNLKIGWNSFILS